MDISPEALEEWGKDCIGFAGWMKQVPDEVLDRFFGPPEEEEDSP